MSNIIPNLENMTDADKIAALESIQKSIAESKEIQKKRIGENVNIVVDALKKIESDIRSRYDEVGNAIEQRVATIKDGRDGIDGKDGRNGKDGLNGKQGVQGIKGKDGRDGRDGTDGIDGVSVTSAHIDFDGSLVIGLSSGIELNVGEVIAPSLAESIKVITNGGGTSQSVLDTLTSLQTQITNLIPSQTGNSGKYLTTNGTSTSWASVSAGGGLTYQGTWNASTNSPTLTSSVGTNGYYYITATAGSTNLNGITDWQIGDWLMYNGTVWQKIDQSNTVTSVNGQTGAVSVGTVTSVSALTLGTTGTDLSSTVATSTTTPVITLNVPTASATNRGVLSSADWTTFNNKGSGTVTSVSGTTGRITSTGGTTPIIDLTSGVATAGTTGSSSLIPVVTIDTYGRVTGITTASNPQGTVTSVTGTSPVASSGGATPAISLASGYGDTLNPYASKTANYVLAAPNGSAGVPTFRAIVAADIPTLNQNTSGSAASLSATLAIASGGTGQTTANTAFNALAPSQTSNSGKYLTTDGTNTSWGTVSASAATPTALGTVYGKTDSVSIVALGYQALSSNTGTENTAVGFQAGQVNTSGGVTAFGKSALSSNTTGADNTALGKQALASNNTGNSNVGVGFQALYLNTTASNNTAVGYQAGYSATTQGGYTFVGYQAGKNTTVNGNASAFGQNALLANTTGYSICAIGDDALKANTTGFQNTAVGSGAMSANTTGTYNNCLGASSFGSLTTGDSNIAMGRGAGGTITTGNNCIYIGRDASASATGSAKENVFGYGLTGKGDFTTFIGTVGTSNVYQVNNSASWATTSDFRLKKNIVDNNQGLDVISQIRVRNFEYRTEEEVTELPTSQVIKKSGVQLGVIAQELQAVLPDCVKQESTGVFTVNSDNLTWYLINAVKELKAELDALKAKVA